MLFALCRRRLAPIQRVFVGHHSPKATSRATATASGAKAAGLATVHLAPSCEGVAHATVTTDSPPVTTSSAHDAHIGSSASPHPMKGMGFVQGKKRYCWRPFSTEEGVTFPMAYHNGGWRSRFVLFGMPQGYPESCAVGFRRYFSLSLTSSFVSSFASSIGYQSILNGFFVTSSPQLWMLKDLLPALGAAYLANRIISYENRPKFWFVVSVVIHNLSVIAEMMVPWAVPHHLLAGAILTSCVRQSASLMFLVTRASALQHFAITNNLAELTKKFNSFSMVIYTVATALGIAYTSVVTTLVAQLVTVVFCCTINLFISFQSMRKIAFRVLNPTTMSVILRDYTGKGGNHHRHVPTPVQVSKRIGLAMTDKLACERHDRTCLLYVSPPVETLRIRSDRLTQDVLYVCASGSFVLALWEPRVPLSLRQSWLRWEPPEAWRRFRLRFASSAARKESMLRKHFSQRLVLLVQNECDTLHLLTAYLIAYTALLHHAESVTELREFLISCNETQSTWLRHGNELVEALRRAEWDVHQLALDPPDFRLSSLRFASSWVDKSKRTF